MPCPSSFRLSKPYFRADHFNGGGSVLATKYEQALALGDSAAVVAALVGRTVVDITNPLAADYMSLTIGHASSAAEEIARRFPYTHVVKAFNTVFASLLVDRAAGQSIGIPVFIAGDQEATTQGIAGLVREMGFTAVLAGPLSNARYLEPMAELMIQFGYGLGHGDRIGFTLHDESKAAAVAAIFLRQRPLPGVRFPGVDRRSLGGELS